MMQDIALLEQRRHEARRCPKATSGGNAKHVSKARMNAQV